jgi:hypothetical protein
MIITMLVGDLKKSLLDSHEGKDIFGSDYRDAYNKGLYCSKLIESLMK